MDYVFLLTLVTREAPSGASHSSSKVCGSTPVTVRGQGPGPAASVLDEDSEETPVSDEEDWLALALPGLQRVRVSLPHRRLFSAGCKGFLCGGAFPATALAFPEMRGLEGPSVRRVEAGAEWRWVNGLDGKCLEALLPEKTRQAADCA